VGHFPYREKMEETIESHVGSLIPNRGSKLGRLLEQFVAAGVCPVFLKPEKPS
jgi:hypothetical protein